MTRVLFALAASFTFACGSTPAGNNGNNGNNNGTGSNELFSVTSPEFTLGPGEEKTYCYYTKLTNPQPFGVRRFESTMSPGSHHLILFTLKEATRPEGTLEACGFPRSGGFGGSRVIPVWAYAAQEPEANIEMPSGVGMTMAADQQVVIQMHYLNASERTLTPRVTVKMYRHLTDDYVRAAPFVTYATNISVPAGRTGEVKGTCVVPPNVKFFLASTHSHRFTTSARVLDGDEVVVNTTDWAHPKVMRWMAEPHRVFQSGSLTYHCTYNNTANERLTTGDSALTDEMCMGVGYFFPATTGGRWCFDGAVFPI